MAAMATIERFNALDADPDAVHATIERDGVAILEGLLSAEVVSRVNDEVGAVLDDADPDAELFNPIMKAFHGPCTKQITSACAISPTFATEVMCHPLLLALCDRIFAPVLRALPAQPRPPSPARTRGRRAVAPPRRGSLE